jgi:amino acid adenylation domain-containing protein
MPHFEPVLLDDWFRAAAAREPGSVALRINSGQYTYAELDGLAASWAGTLLRDGARPRRVGLLAAKSLELYAGFLAALYAGAAAVPLSPEMPPERIAAIAAAAGVDALIVNEAGAAQLGVVAAAIPAATILAPLGAPVPAACGGRTVAPDHADGDRGLPREDRSESDLAYLLFTSGSTGRPKGVPISHANIGAYLRAMLPRYDLGPGDSVTQVYELTFDLSMFEVWMAWASGSCLCAMNRLQALQPARYARKYGLTVWVSTPSLVNALKARDMLPAGSLPGLRYSVFCGEPLPARSAWYWQDAAPNSTLDNLYGPTELTISCTGLRCPPGQPAPAAPNGTVPVGEPNEGMEYLLAGGPDAEGGELCLTGPQMFGGYLDPAEDADRFLTTGGRTWYRTGDRAERAGRAGLVHLGRIDGQLKVQGYRIEPSEIEHAIRAEVPGAEAVTCLVDTDLVAYVITPEPADLAGLAVRLSARLPGYMLPRRLWRLDAAPLNRNGKIDRAGLHADARQRLADVKGAAR